MIRCSNPQLYYAKRQTSAWRLAFRRLYPRPRFTYQRHSLGAYIANRNNKLLRKLETEWVMTPLKPGEPYH